MPSKMSAVEELISQTNDLPSLPEAALKVVRQANDPSTNSETVARTLANDQGLSARILKMSNSAFYGLPRQVTTLNDAVVVLGMRTVRHIALLASTFPFLSKGLPGYDLAPQALWRHSICVALCAQALAKRSGLADPDEAFTLGLLHDIGKIVLSVYMEPETQNILKKSLEQNIGFDQAELEVFGFTHADVGSCLVSKWNLPELFSNAIKLQHTPELSKTAPGLCEILHLADVICLTLGVGVGCDGLNYPLSREALVKLDLTEVDLEIAAEELIDTIAKSQPLFEMIA